MTTSKYKYGTTVVEFIEHDDTELQKLINRAEAQYYHRSEGLHFKGLAAHIDLVCHKPLDQSLIELEAFTLKGYKVHKADYRPLFFTCILRKPEKMIKAELPKITEMAKAEYDELRYAANVAEMQRQMEITIEKRARDAAAAAAKAAAEHRTAEEKFALEDLLRAYSLKTKAEVEQEASE